VLQTLQPQAKLIRAVRGKIDPQEILNTELFNFEHVAASAGWLRELDDDHDDAHDDDHDHDHHETENFGISSTVYRRHRPFHPARFSDWIENHWPSAVVRSKGFLWLATRNQMVIIFGQAGSSIQIEDGGDWLADLPESEREDVLEAYPEVRDTWHPVWGDRKTELVLIGIEMDEDAVAEALDECLLTDDEMDEDWSDFDDPLPEIEIFDTPDITPSDLN